MGIKHVKLCHWLTFDCIQPRLIKPVQLIWTKYIDGRWRTRYIQGDQTIVLIDMFEATKIVRTVFYTKQGVIADKLEAQVNEFNLEAMFKLVVDSFSSLIVNHINSWAKT